jgi:PIN domain nuclease of toxin-antitoxin system
LKLLLDTTYFLPAIGIAIKGLPNDAPITLLAKGHQVCISEITLFELSAKGAKYVHNGALLPETVTDGIRAIAHGDEIVAIPVYDTGILLESFNLRKALNDFIDCLIVSSAIKHCDALITEDEEIHGLKKNNSTKELIATNPNFRIQKLNDTL